MLLNNFKPLFSFYEGHKFVNVLGNNVNIYDFLLRARNSGLINGHSINCAASKFNYTTTTGSNNYIDEKTTYLWGGIISTESYFNTETQYNGMTLFIGTGNRTVQADDYCLENSVVLSVTAASCIHYSNEKTIISRTFYNNTGENVTIQEIGCYLFAHQGSTYSPGGQPVVMIGRKVLQNPVVIPEGEQYTFHYTIDMSRISFAEADYSN